jgi:hypothetical protein
LLAGLGGLELADELGAAVLLAFYEEIQVRRTRRGAEGEGCFEDGLLEGPAEVGSDHRRAARSGFSRRGVAVFAEVAEKLGLDEAEAPGPWRVGVAFATNKRFGEAEVEDLSWSHRP